MVSDLRRGLNPHWSVACRSPGDNEDHYRSPHLNPLFEGRENQPAPTAFLCQQFACQAPVSGFAAIRESLGLGT